MAETREVRAWRSVRVRCGIGHESSGRVRVVQRQGHDSDGEAFWYPPSNEYDPDSCVVCGLKIWSVVGDE